MKHLRLFGPSLVLLMTVLTIGCGGGGGGGSGEPLLSTQSQDIVPSGARIDVASRNLFPLHVGDAWLYDRKTGDTVSGTITRGVVGGPDADGWFTLREVDGAGTEDGRERTTASGSELFDPLGAQGTWPGAFTALPSYTEYSTPLYAVGGVRQTVRQGDLQADLDGDGKSDYYRVDISQVFRGFETLTVVGRATEVAHFTNTFAFRTVASKDGATYTVTGIEEAYFASNLGLVRADRQAIDSAGATVVAPHMIELRGATVNGQVSGIGTAPTGNTITVNQTHAALVLDATRNRFYASVPSGDAQGNRIATVDAQSGALTYSAVLGSDPGPLAIAADGNTLFVGLNGSGEVLRLALPSMQVIDRVTLPVSPNFGQLRAEHISASPTASDTFAVALARPAASPRGSGVALVRNMIVQPQRTKDFSDNRIAFDPTGNWIYSVNLETSGWDVRRNQVVSDGVLDATSISNGEFTQSLDVRDGLVVVGRKVYSDDAGLAALGQVTNGSVCRKVPSVAKLVCLSATDFGTLEVADASTFSLLGSIKYASTGDPVRSFVFGAPGQLALSTDSRILLFSTSAVR